MLKFNFKLNFYVGDPINIFKNVAWIVTLTSDFFLHVESCQRLSNRSQTQNLSRDLFLDRSPITPRIAVCRLFPSLLIQKNDNGFILACVLTLKFRFLASNKIHWLEWNFWYSKYVRWYLQLLFKVKMIWVVLDFNIEVIILFLRRILNSQRKYNYHD